MTIKCMDSYFGLHCDSAQNLVFFLQRKWFEGLNSILISLKRKFLTMGSGEKFGLRWNDFEANISSAFHELKEEKDFTDVTLACADNQVEAHKVI